MFYIPVLQLVQPRDEEYAAAAGDARVDVAAVRRQRRRQRRFARHRWSGNGFQPADQEKVKQMF